MLISIFLQKIFWFLQKILVLYTSSFNCAYLRLESRRHEIESCALIECIAHILSNESELICMSRHPEVEFAWELADEAYEPLLIFFWFSWYLLACFGYLMREMDDTCSYISDILYADARISIVDIHIWEDGWVEIHDSGFPLGYIRLRKKEHEQRDPDESNNKK